MAVLDIIENWLSPITDPLSELSGHLDMMQQTHLDSLNDFQAFMSDLTVTAPPGEQWTGISAEEAVQWVEEYLASERALSVPGATLDTVAQVTNTAIDDVGVASENLAADVADDTVITEVTAAVDAADVMQAGLDPVTDLAGLILTIVDITLYFSALVTFGWAVYQATQAFINALSQARNQPQPKLPKTPTLPPTPTPSLVPLPPVALNHEQQKIVRRLHQEFPDVSPDLIEELVAAGLTEDEIRALLRSGSQAILVYVLSAIRTKTLDSKTLKDLLRNADLAQRVIDDARKGKVKKAKNYHGRLPSELEQEILSNPDAVYVAKNGRFIFRKGNNIVVTEGAGSGRGSMVTSYGPAGPRGSSGAASLGGSPTDPGAPVTDDMIINGTIPDTGGGTLPPATRIYP